MLPHVPLNVFEPLFGWSSVKTAANKPCLSDYSWEKIRPIKLNVSSTNPLVIYMTFILTLQRREPEFREVNLPTDDAVQGRVLKLNSLIQVDLLKQNFITEG